MNNLQKNAKNIIIKMISKYPDIDITTIKIELKEELKKCYGIVVNYTNSDILEILNELIQENIISKKIKNKHEMYFTSPHHILYN